MENQHRLIKGYRELSAEEIALMNESKELAEKVGALVRTIDEHVTHFCQDGERRRQDEGRVLLPFHQGCP